MITSILLSAALPLVPYPQHVVELGGSVGDPEVVVHTDDTMPVEGYRLRVADGRAEVFSATEAGAFYARQTLAQLRGADGSCPCVEIEDAPAFPWRGVLIDESRHFWGKEVVKRVLDRMAAFKLNVFHWHLTDSHGWRIQIDRYPELTDRGARRPIPDWDWNIRDEANAVGEYGPFFYTKDDIREVLAYAKARYIRVIPEIEIPGHSRELILCHPDFSCLDWGRFVDMARTRGEVDQAAALCVGNDDVMTFMENVLDEVVELFPDEIVHIGGDECPRGNWKACPKCQQRMKDENLKGEDELQAWVTRRFSKYLAKKNRKIVGWDEILSGGLPEGAIVMSWRGSAGGIEAAAQGHDAIVCPHQLCYLDYPTGELSDACEYPRFCRTAYVNLERSYSFDPYEGIPTNQWKHVLGSQTLNWGESTWDEKSLEYKMWPRTCANAEVVWTGPKKHTFADFRARLEPIARRMAATGVNVSLDPLRGRGAYEELMPIPQRIQYRPARVPLSSLGKVTVKRENVAGAPEAVAEESYVLDISADGVVITAPTEKGVRYAKVTLGQLKKLTSGTECVLSARIVDWPKFRWRGYMPDTARNFLPVGSMKEMIDVMAAYKLNLLHWHLTEHYGWRLESKKYPELHAPKAFLNRHPGKYYTQEECREIVDYAWARGIAVMPELDVPGHATAFRHAFGLKNMDNPRATEIIEDLFRELCTLTSVEKMPFVHMGTDEVWNKKIEGAKPESISRWAKAVTDSGRRVVSWDPGQEFVATNRIAMLWGGRQYAGFGNPSFDANGMYIEIIDPFELLPHGTYHAQFWEATAPSNRWGAVFCGWHDGFVGENYDNVFRNQAVFPCCVLYGKNFWNGPKEDNRKYRSRLPLACDPLLGRAVEIERRVIAQRDKVLTDLRHPFHFVGQTHMRWRLTNEKGELIAKDIAQATISPRKDPKSSGNFTEVTNGTMIAETWIRSPKTQTVGAWIGFLGMDRDHGLERLASWDATTPKLGEWNIFGASAELNGEKIAPPEWKRPGLKQGKALEWCPVPWWYELGEEPYTDQEYFMREPTPITLKEGWNHVKLTAPCPGKNISWSGRSWIMTFCPILGTTDHPQEVPGLEYSSDPK